ncbi:EAL domain-containing protein [Glaciecola sp. MH2013]|uniref:putative bifunctional diguanylate cyclase/phosphodiesterase n=1 Tax=Glaciecola sp. MH2013 TaxID=2785524 RepID=UPI0018A10035|nr:EAL domain-containing protein [Glaciecola sp. MH2013]MBF7073094.1 EAL domain-containing protein [Glaciecola sp. MH2013]
MSSTKHKLSSIVQIKQLSMHSLGLTTQQINDVEIKLLSSISKLLYLTQPFNFLNALLLAFLFQDFTNSQVLNSAVSFLCAISVCWLIWSEYFWRNNRSYISNVVAMRIHSIFSFSVSAGFSFLVYYLFPSASEEGRLLLVALITGMICGGAFALCMVPRAAFFWVVPLSVTSIHVGFTLDDFTFSVILSLITLFYAGLVATITLNLHKTYLLRIAAENKATMQKIQAETQKQTMSVLMSDFENHVSDWLWELDEHGKLSHLPTKVMQAVNISEEELSTLDLPGLLLSHFHCSEHQYQKRIERITSAIKNTEEFSAIVLPLYVEDEIVWMSLSGKPLRAKNHIIGWRGVCKDVTSEFTHKAEIEKLAKTDLLTGLPNRFQFNSYATRFESGAIPFMIMMIDLDNFKEVNDVFGHHEGDKLLQLLASRLEKMLKPKEMIARLGGDEFILLSTELKQASRRASQILECFQSPVKLTNSRIEVRASIGVSIAPQHGVALNDLVKKADIAMYAAKASGKGQFAIFDAEIEEQNNKRIEMMSDLKLAVKEKQFFVEYQPQIDSFEGKVTGLEALVRWEHPVRGRISPADFIELAEETGHIIAIGKYVLEQACRDALSWPSDVKVCVNVSGVQFLKEDFLDMVTETLNTTGLPAARLELEVTESAIIENIVEVNSKLKQLKKQGVGIALDDFGTGFSSLSYLQQLSIDNLKIDRSFISELDTEAGEARSSAIVDVILKLAKGLALTVTIEGVETQSQLEKVNLLGGYTIQGFYFSKPLCVDDVPAFVEGFVLDEADELKQKA